LIMSGSPNQRNVTQVETHPRTFRLCVPVTTSVADCCNRYHPVKLAA